MARKKRTFWKRDKRGRFANTIGGMHKEKTRNSNRSSLVKAIRSPARKQGKVNKKINKIETRIGERKSYEARLKAEFPNYEPDDFDHIHAANRKDRQAVNNLKNYGSVRSPKRASSKSRKTGQHGSRV